MRLIDADAWKEDIIQGLQEAQKKLEGAQDEGQARVFFDLIVDLKTALDMMNERQTIEAVPVKRGKWVWHYRLKRFVCINCGFEQKHKPDFKYCPNCGARMD